MYKRGKGEKERESQTEKEKAVYVQRDVYMNVSVLVICWGERGDDDEVCMQKRSCMKVSCNIEQTCCYVKREELNINASHKCLT